MISLDDRTKESKSYSTTRILIDCFQWERIYEWVTLKIDDKVFEVFAKEFGSEVYSVQSHSDLGTEYSTSMEELRTVSLVRETPVQAEQSPATTSHRNLKIQNVADPLAEGIINCN
ncbi:hypothetical protein PIB30_087950 [Stylosanthes scabra]|uniref:Uncharacterized protein n=1 Tax=Stylosanthes scabra TaxID=79078 RepID=A0ABU6UVD2_9FABA|nr:hypothetical protein [Stylosanthes scabra]